MHQHYAYIGLAKSWIIYNAHRWQDSLAVKDALFFSQRAIELDPESGRRLLLYRLNFMVITIRFCQSPYLF